MTEQQILALIAQPKSRQEGFVELMTLYREPLYWHIRRLVVVHEDAEDVLQETFINVHRYIQNFRGGSSLKTWLYRVATNEAIRHCTRRKLDSTSYDEHNLLIELYEGERSIDFGTMEAKLQRAILSLSQKQRIAFNLRYYDELSYEQMAEVTGSSEATLKTNYHLASKKIKELMLNQLDNQ